MHGYQLGGFPRQIRTSKHSSMEQGGDQTVRSIIKPQTVKPQALSKGDAVAIVAPSGAVRRESLQRGVRLLESLGLRVKLGHSVMKRWGYLAGQDTDRARDLMEAWADPEVKAVIAARGGYGAMRILPYLDFNCIGQNPKILLGYSDITALHLAFLKEAGLVTFHGPVAEIWSDSMEPYNLEMLKDMLFGNWTPGYLPMPVFGGKGSISPGSASVSKESCSSGSCNVDSPALSQRELVVLEKGEARGCLTGGNLSLVASTIGTAWEIDTSGKILFLEEVGERPYRVDRMLCQLKLAGKLDDAAGFCLGDFIDCETDPDPARPSFSVSEVLEQYFAGAGKPCISNIPAGHGKYNAVLPLGVEVRIEAGLAADESEPRLYFPEKATI